ncbi:MAG: hypothetical protein ACPMAQ_00105 [Phycisphaerae bacterium]
MRHLCSAAMVLLYACSEAALAATVTFDLAPVSATSGGEVVVAPGQTVEYQLTAIVASDTEVADNHGLEAFAVSIQTDSGIAQPPLDAFGPLIAQYLAAFPSLGTAQNGQIADIRASQLGLGTPFFEGIGVGQAVVLATGHFNTPATEGTFTVKVADNPTAIVIGAGSKEGLAIPANGHAGPGFTIRTSNAASGGAATGSDQSNTGGDQGATDQSGAGATTPTQTAGATQPLPPALQAIAVLAGTLVGLVMAYALFGPMGLALGLVLVPLLAYILLLMSGR